MYTMRELKGMADMQGKERRVHKYSEQERDEMLNKQQILLSDMK
jgi:hypothetical protein